MPRYLDAFITPTRVAVESETMAGTLMDLATLRFLFLSLDHAIAVRCRNPILSALLHLIGTKS